MKHADIIKMEPPPENTQHALFQSHNAQCLQQLGQILALNSTVLTQIAPFTSCLKNNL